MEEEVDVDEATDGDGDDDGADDLEPSVRETEVERRVEVEGREAGAMPCE